MKNSKNPNVLNEYFTLKNAISNRIEVLENFFDDNLNNPRYLTLEKGIIKLKKLLFYYPDANNELEEPDIHSFRGLQLEAGKAGGQKEKKANVTKTKTMTANKPNAANYSSAKKPQRLDSGKVEEENPSSSKKQGKAPATAAGKRPKKLASSSIPSSARGDEDGDLSSPRRQPLNTKANKNNNKENNFTNGNVIKKTIKVRLTADEYKLLEKLRNKRMLTVK